MCFSYAGYNFIKINQSVLFVTAILDIIFGWKARRSMSFAVKLRYVLKLVSAAAWVVILPVTYAYTWENPTGLARTIKSWLGDGQNQPSLYILAVVIYLAPNILASMLFLFPFLRRFLESSNLNVITIMMWWSQVAFHLLVSAIDRWLSLLISF
jgi:callose synthase